MGGIPFISCSFYRRHAEEKKYHWTEIPDVELLMRNAVTCMWEFQSTFKCKLIEATHTLWGKEVINIIPFITGPSFEHSKASSGQ